MIVIGRVMAIGSMGLATLVAHAEPVQEFDVVVERYVVEALHSNLALQGETLEVDKATQALAAARARFFPEVSLLARYSRADGGRDFSIPVGTALNPVFATLNELLIAQGQPPRFAPTDDITVPFLRREEQDTRVVVRQPLYAPAIPAAVRAQRALLDASSFNRMAVARALRRDVTIGYLDWLKARSAVDIVSASQALLRDLFLAQHQLALGDTCLPRASCVATAIEDAPGEQQRRRAEVVALTGAVIHALRAAVESQREYRPFLLARNGCLFRRGASLLLDPTDFRTALQRVRPQERQRLRRGRRFRRRVRRLDRCQQLPVQQEVEETLRLRCQVLGFAQSLFDGQQLGFGPQHLVFGDLAVVEQR